MAETTEAKTADTAQAVPMRMDDLPSLNPTKQSGESIGLGHILDVTVPVTVELGQTRLSIAGLAQLAAGSLVTLDREAHEPVDILVNGRLIARGEVVTVGAKYGVRITSMAG
jgi:flagellar motor switch protein FliN/FliY